MQENQEVLNSFMSDKNREALGEKVDELNDNNDNFLPDEGKVKQSFTDASVSKNDDKTYMYARMFLNALVTVPLIIAILFMLFYAMYNFAPFILNFIKNFFKILV